MNHMLSGSSLFCKKLEHTDCDSLLTGGGEMEASSFYRHCNSPWAFLSVLCGISVMTSQSYLSYFKTAELILPPYWGACHQ